MESYDEFVKAFFKERFKKTPEEDPDYYKEWYGRLKTPTLYLQYSRDLECCRAFDDLFRSMFKND